MELRLSKQAAHKLMCATECSAPCHARRDGRAMWVACNRAKFPATPPRVFCELKIMKIVILIYQIIQEKFANYELYEGGSKSPCNHLCSLHMGAVIQRWQCLHQVWTFVFHAMYKHGHCCTLGCTTALALKKCILGTTNWTKLAGNLNCEKTTW